MAADRLPEAAVALEVAEVVDMRRLMGQRGPMVWAAVEAVVDRTQQIVQMAELVDLVLL